VSWANVSTNTTTYTNSSPSTILDQQQDESGTTWFLGDNITYKVAQTFQPSVPTRLTSFAFYVFKQGSPTDALQLQIYTDGSTQPGTFLATSETLVAGGSLTTSSQLQTFTFNNGPTLTTDTTYWAILSRTGSQDGTNYYKIEARLSSTNNKYTRGKIFDTNNLTWTNYDDATHFYDLRFYEYYASPWSNINKN
jgi:hypothetical protein